MHSTYWLFYILSNHVQMYIDPHAFVQPEQARHPIPRYKIKLTEDLFPFIDYFLPYPRMKFTLGYKMKTYHCNIDQFFWPTYCIALSCKNSKKWMQYTATNQEIVHIIFKFFEEIIPRWELNIFAIKSCYVILSSLVFIYKTQTLYNKI